MTDQSVHPEANQPPFARFGPWTWRDPERGEHFRRCSFCGSVHPGDLAAEPFWTAQWADQKYGWPHKFYVDVVNRQPDALFVISAAFSEEPPGPLSGGPYVAVTDLTPEQAAAAERDGYLRDRTAPVRWLAFGTRPAHHGKFYTVHLRDADLPPQVKHAIEQRSGLVFEFDGTRVAWRPVDAPPTGMGG